MLLCACSSSSASSGSPSPDGGNAGCLDLAGTWNITGHCDASLIGQSAVVTQTDCAISTAAPFDGFTGTVTGDGKITLSGPQSCTGTVTANSISMTCTPGMCAVTLAR